MAISRRDWLKGTTAVTATAIVGAGCDDGPGEDPVVCAEADDVLPSGLPTDGYSGAPGPVDMFQHGVASGDPLTDRVILWTRVSTGAATPVEVFYEMALDPAFTKRVAAGTAMTDANSDFTVKVDPTGLVAARTYYYRFRCMGRESPIGRTKTLPVGDVRHLRFVTASCANYGFGYFHVYRHIAARADIDAVLFLGDYIYEFEDGAYPNATSQLRAWDPPYEIVSLDDYRTRYRQYKSDPDLQEAHRQHAWICTWDDHEITNDSYLTGAMNHMPLTEGDYSVRRTAAIRAYYEYLPIRGVPEVSTMYRNFAFGSLAEVVVLDTRHEGRVQQFNTPDQLASDDASRTMISAEQEAWLASTLSASTATWKLLAQQVMVGFVSKDTVNFTPEYLDQWDGYPAARSRLYDIIENQSGGNVVVLTGDIHASVVSDLARDPLGSSYDPASGSGSLAVEFVCSAVSSPGFAMGFFDEDYLQASPNLKLMESVHRGYIVLDVRPGKVQADFYTVEGVALDQGAESYMTSFAVRDGKPFAVEMSREERPKNECELAP